MDSSQKKEQFSTAFVKAIAAQSGFRIATPNVDDDSIDIIIRGKGFKGSIRNPQIDVQLKCTANIDESSDFLTFNLPLKNYNDLRGDNVLTPRYLFIHVVPKDEKNWLTHGDKFATLSHCCYWASIKDSPNTKNTSSVTIKICKKQILNAESMQSLMDLASNRGSV